MAKLSGSKSVYKAIMKIVEQNDLNLDDDQGESWCKISVDGPYMDLSVEVIAPNQVSITHYREDFYGDLLRDPEMIFFLDRTNEIAYPTYYRQDTLPFYFEQFIVIDFKNGMPYRFRPNWMKEANSFAIGWAKNWKEQGFIK